MHFKITLGFVATAINLCTLSALAFDMSCKGKNRKGEPRMLVVKDFGDIRGSHVVYLLSKNLESDQFDVLIFKSDMKVLSRVDKDENGISRILNLKGENETFELTEDAHTELRLTMRFKTNSSDESEKSELNTSATDCHLEVPEFKLMK